MIVTGMGLCPDFKAGVQDNPRDWKQMWNHLLCKAPKAVAFLCRKLRLSELFFGLSEVCVLGDPFDPFELYLRFWEELYVFGKMLFFSQRFVHV